MQSLRSLPHSARAALLVGITLLYGNPPAWAQQPEEAEPEAGQQVPPPPGPAEPEVPPAPEEGVPLEANLSDPANTSFTPPVAPPVQPEEETRAVAPIDPNLITPRPRPNPGPGGLRLEDLNVRDFIDTRITFTIADNDIARGPTNSSGVSSPNGSPSIPNSLPSADNRLFFDDFERRDRGFENLTHLTLYAKEPGFFEGLTTDAALVLRLTVLGERGVLLQEDGSYLRLGIDLGDEYQLRITAFPVSANRFRLGYSYDISWGGSEIFRNSPATPGLKIDFIGPSMYAFIGFKTGLSQIDQPDGTVENDTVGGVLAGGGVDILDELRVEGNGGFFYRGTINKQELRVPDGAGGIVTAPWLGYGGSVQLTYHMGIPIGTPIDFRLYRNDPLLQQNFFRRETYPEDGVSFLVQSEATVLGQTLQDPDRPTTTTNQLATAVDLSARVKFNKVRIHLLAVFRTLEFILYNVPSFTPFVDFSSGIKASPEVFVSLAADYFIEALNLTPGLVFGIQRPAHVTGSFNAGDNPPGSLGQQTFVVLNETERAILDPGDPVELVYAGKVTFRWDLSEIIQALGELQVSYDQNLRVFTQDPSGIVLRQRTDPTIVGFTLLLRARF